MKLSAMDEAFVICRARGHVFYDIPDDGGSRREFRESRTVGRLAKRCDRCMTIRYDIWDKRTGEPLIAPQYVYPTGYLNGGKDKMHLYEYRVQYFKNLNGTRQ